MKKCLCVCTTLALAIAAAGCGSGTSTSQTSGNASNREAGSSKQYAELHWGSTPWQGPLNWYYSCWPEAGAIESLAVQSLVEFESDGKPKLGLASSVEHPNPTTYIYKIRSGVRFSDGKPMTVADVLFSFSLADGKESLVTKGLWQNVASFSADGNSAVVIKLKHPEAPWPSIFAMSSQVIEKAAADKFSEKALGTPGDLPVGTGPWKLDSYQPSVGVHLSRNPYWKGQPQPAQRITVSVFKEETSLALALRSGTIDGAFDYLLPKPFADIPGARQITAPNAGNIYLGINKNYPPFNDIHVRRAIAYATDVKGMMKAIFGEGNGLAAQATSFLPASLLGTNVGSKSEIDALIGSLPKYEFNLAAAKRELERSAYPHGFSTTIDAQPNESFPVLIGQVLSSDLAKIGITAKVRLVQLDEIPTMTGRNVTIYPSELGSLYPDPNFPMSSMLGSKEILPSGSGLNWAQYRNAEVDKLLAQQAETVNPTTRLELIGKILHVEEAELPYRALFSHSYYLTLSNKYVFPTFSWWTTLVTPWALNVKLAS